MIQNDYLNLVDRAASFFLKHGTVCLVDLAEAASLGIVTDSFTSHVEQRAAEITLDTQE